MRTLAIECATEACSVALFADDELLAGDHRILGRGHAEHLVPMIAELPDKGRADRILVSLGPGSFTGVRIGIATARALGVAWDAEVVGYPTLALVAQVAFENGPRFSDNPLTVAMHGGHGEWFVQNFAADGLPASGLLAKKPQDAAAHAQSNVAGTQAAELVALRGTGSAHQIHPDARLALQIPGHLLDRTIDPIYGREPDAKPAAKPAPRR